MKEPPSLWELMRVQRIFLLSFVLIAAFLGGGFFMVEYGIDMLGHLHSR